MRELFALQIVVIRMSLDRLEWNRVALAFEYLREDGALVARGDHEIACMTREPDGTLSILPELPAPLAAALARYQTP